MPNQGPHTTCLDHCLSVHAIFLLSLETSLKCVGQKLNLHVSRSFLTQVSCSWEGDLGCLSSHFLVLGIFQGFSLLSHPVSLTRNVLTDICLQWLPHPCHRRAESFSLECYVIS